MSYKEGSQWFSDGPLDEIGRGILLERFGLTEAEDKFPLETLRSIGPNALMKHRRDLEAKLSLKPPIDNVISDTIGNHIEAMAA